MSEEFTELGELFPKLSPGELAAAKETLDAYLLLAWEIWEEHSAGTRNNPSDATTFTNPQLTVGNASSRIQVKVDSPHINQPLKI